MTIDDNTIPIRVYDIAKKLRIESREVLDKAKELGIASAKVPSSTLDKSTADFLESDIQAEMAANLGRGLRGFQLGNFKAFAGTQSIPIRPLTLIFGSNSSGKSSVIHGLLLARMRWTPDKSTSRERRWAASRWTWVASGNTCIGATPAVA